MKSITLTEADLTYLEAFKRGGKKSIREFNRVNILLLLHKGKKSAEIGEFLNVDRITIWRTKKKYSESGVELALQEDQRPGQPVKYTTDHHAELAAMACGPCPEGRKRWTVRLLTKELKKKPELEKISRESVRLALKKMNVNLG
jgi:putative transposase